MKSLILIALLSSSAHAEQTFYIKHGDKFVIATKIEALFSLIKKEGEVYRCNKQMLSDKATIKNQTKE